MTEKEGIDIVGEFIDSDAMSFIMSCICTAVGNGTTGYLFLGYLKNRIIQL